MSKLVFLDFEFNGLFEPKLNLVSVAARAMDNGVMTYTREYWLHNDVRQCTTARNFFQKLIDEDYTFVAYVGEAETRGLHALFGYVPKFKMIDLYLEYRCLLNQNDKLSYGKQYINGEEITTSPPPDKWAAKSFMPEELEVLGHHKPSFSLAAAVFKCLGAKIDTAEKNTVRDIIISAVPASIEANRERIINYNMSDLDHLPGLLDFSLNYHRKHGETIEGWLKAAHLRGDYAVRTARMTIAGYPINKDKVDNFTSNVKGILNEAVQDCLEYSAEVESFRFDTKKDGYVAVEKNIRDWVSEQKHAKWRKTEKKSLSLSRDAFTDYYDSGSPGFAGAYCRFLKTKQSLNGFMPVGENSDRRTFQSFVGSDGRVRPQFGIYGSQTSRSQPSSTAYLWLKSSWMQNFLEAPRGRALASCDFSSQEFLIAALVSQDKAMIAAYETGDVYLAFGKLIRMIPESGTKESHNKERNICKTAVLGLSYGMSETSLAPRLSQATGVEYTVAQAAAIVKDFQAAFPDYDNWKHQVASVYNDNHHLQLSDGWTMFGDNPNQLSVKNFTVQGEGAVILRESVRLCQDAGLVVVATVHDSIVVDIPSDRAEFCVDILKNSMIKGFDNVMKHYGKTSPIRVEGECWSQDFTKPYTLGDFKFMQELIPGKSIKEHERFKKFFLSAKINGSSANKDLTPIVPVVKVARKKRVPKLINVPQLNKAVSNGVHDSID